MSEYFFPKGFLNLKNARKYAQISFRDFEQDESIEPERRSIPMWRKCTIESIKALSDLSNNQEERKESLGVLVKILEDTQIADFFMHARNSCRNILKAGIQLEDEFFQKLNRLYEDVDRFGAGEKRVLERTHEPLTAEIPEQ